MNDLSIYQEKILNLANENKKSIAIEDFNRSFEVKNPMCGDEVKVRLKLIDKKSPIYQQLFEDVLFAKHQQD